jgi:hypothetical protein
MTAPDRRWIAARTLEDAAGLPSGPGRTQPSPGTVPTARASRQQPAGGVRSAGTTARRRGLVAAWIAAAWIAPAVIAGCGGGDEPASATATAEPATASTTTAQADETRAEAGAARLRRDRFDSSRAWKELVRQVELGPRPAGSDALRGLAERLRDALPKGRFERVPGHPGLRNVVGRIPGRTPAIAIAAHYDTKELPGFVGANDGAAGTAVVMELARALRRADRPENPREVRFLLFDGEEATDDSRPFEATGLRGSTAYAKRHDGELKSLVLLDFVGAKELQIFRERLSDGPLWDKLRAAARRVGAQAAFPGGIRRPITDDHVPFLERGVPAIDLIQWPYDCWHLTCDDLTQVEERSLDLTGETVYELVRTLRRT